MGVPAPLQAQQLGLSSMEEAPLSADLHSLSSVLPGKAAASADAFSAHSQPLLSTESVAACRHKTNRERLTPCILLQVPRHAPEHIM